MQNSKQTPEIKARRQGNSTTLTVPASFGVSSEKRYRAELKADGTIVYHPVKTPKNIFDTDYDYAAAMTQMNLTDNGKLVGRENVW